MNTPPRKTLSSSFTEALKASLRIAPHVVRVGECREGPPARMAFDAANTGKLVSTTIHCAGVLNIPSRYEELGVPTLLAYSAERHANSLRAITGYCRQRTTDEFLAEIKGKR